MLLSLKHTHVVPHCKRAEYLAKVPSDVRSFLLCQCAPFQSQAELVAYHSVIIRISSRARLLGGARTSANLNSACGHLIHGLQSEVVGFSLCFRTKRNNRENDDSVSRCVTQLTDRYAPGDAAVTSTAKVDMRQNVNDVT